MKIFNDATFFDSLMPDLMSNILTELPLSSLDNERGIIGDSLISDLNLTTDFADETLRDKTLSKLINATQSIERSLKTLAEDEIFFYQTFTTAFGDNFDQAIAESLRLQFLEEDFSGDRTY